MRLRGLVLGSALVLVGSPIAGVRGQEPDEAHPDATMTVVQDRVRQLTKQAEVQRAQLRETEALLERAKALAEQLGRREPMDSVALSMLRDEEARARRQVESVRRLMRSKNDPALAHAKRRLAEIREAILTVLREDESRAERHVRDVRRIIRRDNDPALAAAERRLAEIREAIRRELEDRGNPPAPRVTQPGP